MIKRLYSGEIYRTSVFGGFCPYWTIIDNKVLISDSIEELILKLPESERLLDPVGVLELLRFNYLLGDRTLIQGIKKLPWRVELSGDGLVNRYPSLLHNNKIVDSRYAAKILRELLEEEIFAVIKDCPKIYLLTSGGLDSRIIAGIVKYLENEISGKISCITWGKDNSRDVIYAKRIADWYAWDLIHIPYTWQMGWENIKKSATWGCSEITGIHLHGLRWFENATPDDVVISASFGDSIGRAEYSGKHLSNLSFKQFDIKRYN